MGVFDPVATGYDFPALERKILAFWNEREIFHRSLQKGRDGAARRFVFYEGPPTANGTPHNGHVLTRAIKDLFPRYRTMRGEHVPRKAGWDTHGLPVEIEVEKELGIHGREAIIEYGVEPFTRRCIENVFKYTAEWERLTERIAFWIDMPQAYVTYHTSYVESVWWALSELYKKDLLYRGHKVVWWWPQGGTALSAGEVGEGYREVTDPAVTVRFAVAGEERLSFLAWTTTPWTLPSNLALAVGEGMEYSVCELSTEGGSERVIVASALVESIFADRAVRIAGTRKGSELLGLRYEPLYRFEEPIGGDPWRVIPGDFVSTEQGTGVVHIAPGFGEDDNRVGREQDTGFVQILTPDGHFPAHAGPLAGRSFKEADPLIIADLEERGLVFDCERHTHDYPFCPRSERDPLIQYARRSWFIRTTSLVENLLANNRAVHWLPEHIKEGRFGDFLANNVDWALSRERFWGTPLNVWVNDESGAMDCPSSVAEILARNPAAFDHFHAARREDPTLLEHLMVHKPWIDAVTWTRPGESGVYRRVPEVIDCWFDAGCMPFAQFGFPHRGREEFAAAWPADFISEAIDQTRGWFYSLLAISTMVFDESVCKRFGLVARGYPHPYKSCIVLGHVCDREGIKESKSKRNYTPPAVILDQVKMPMRVVVAGTPGFEKLLAKLTPGSGVIGLAREDLEGLDLQRKSTLCLRSGARELHGLRGVDAGRAARWAAAGGDVDYRHVVVLSTDQAAELGVESGASLEFEDPTPSPGGDAFRWFFYASNPPWNNTRHSLAGVRQAQKEFLITLHNVYSFFVIYANIDDYRPDGATPALEREGLGEMDRWILSELHLTIREVTANLDGYLLYEAARRLGEFVDSLSNWYVRRSRARFWSAGQSRDKRDAFDTLYTSLATLARLIAPFTPFFAEELHRNLVRGPLGASVPESVHLCEYPQARVNMIDEPLSRRMRAARRIVSLGLSVRSAARLKVRQPLRSARVAVADSELRAELESLRGVIAEELNVKDVELLEDAGAYVSYRLKPNFKALGPRVGKLMPRLKAAIAAADAQVVRAALQSAGSFSLRLESGEEIALSSAEIEVALDAREGFSAASDAAVVVLLETEIDGELLCEMRAREIVNRVQGLRKERRLDYADRIRLKLGGGPELEAAVRAHRGLIAGETLAVECAWDHDLDAQGAQVEAFEVEGTPLFVHLASIVEQR